MRGRELLRGGVAGILGLILTEDAWSQVGAGFPVTPTSVGGSSTVTGTGCLSGATTAPLSGDGNNGCVGTAVTGTGSIVEATSPTLVTPALGTPSAIVLTNATGLPLSTGVTGNLPSSNLTGAYTAITNLTASGAITFSGLGGGGTLCVHASNTGVLSTAAADCGSGGGGLTVGTTTISGGTNGNIEFNNAGVLGELATTGSGNVVRATSPTLVTPALGTPSSVTLTNATGLPVGGITGLGTGVGTALGLAVSGTGAICLASGSSCSGGGASIVIGTTAITSGTNNRLLYDNSGVVGESALTAGTPDLVVTAPATISSTVAQNAQSGASYTIASTDPTKWINRTNTGGAMTDTLPAIGSNAAFGAGFGTVLAVNSTQQDTLTVTTNTINGHSSVVLPARSIAIISDPDGTQYIAGIIQDPSNVLITGGLIDGTEIGSVTPSTGAFTTLSGTSALTLGTAGSSVGSIALHNATSGTLTLAPPTGALGTPTLTLPAATDTVVARATTDTLTNKTISGSSNTLSNIGNGSLTNSATTVNGQTCTLGSTCVNWSSWMSSGTSIATNTTDYLIPLGSGASGSLSTARLLSPSLAGTLGHLHLTVVTAPGAGNSVTITLDTCNVALSCSDTAATCTISNTNTLCTDDADTVAISADQLLVYKIVTSASATATGQLFPSIGFHQ